MIDFIGTDKELITEAATLLGHTLDDFEADRIYKADVLKALRTLDALIFLIGMNEEDKELVSDCRKARLQ